VIFQEGATTGDSDKGLDERGRALKKQHMQLATNYGAKIASITESVSNRKEIAIQ